MRVPFVHGTWKPVRAAPAGPRPRRNTNRWSAAATAIVAISAISFFYLFVLPALFPLLIPLSDPARIGIAVLLVAPLAFAMGMPFPLGLSRIAAGAETLVPWAWGVNACTSVVAAVLAMVLALHLGLTAVVVIAVLLYLCRGGCLSLIQHDPV
ncbi:hypothetical protein [Paraburkholderia franconis]|uniref:hypothetical protein n=1 Tax=Paraburkholderia franconis TaxID=2654983 RepID=UPI001D10EB48|nr:hypothetical protein [Paraburkholderia franconis]